MESKDAAASPPRRGRWIAIGVVVVCCGLALGLGLGCGLTGKDCQSKESRAPPSPLGIPPGGAAFVSGSVLLGGYTAATFDPPASAAFASALATTLRVSSSNVTILQSSSAARRLLQAFIVSFVVSAPNGNAVDALVAGINGLNTSTFSNTLTANLAAVNRPAPTGVTVVSSPQISVGVSAPPVYQWSPPVRACGVCACGVCACGVPRRAPSPPHPNPTQRALVRCS